MKKSPRLLLVASLLLNLALLAAWALRPSGGEAAASEAKAVPASIASKLATTPARGDAVKTGTPSADQSSSAPAGSSATANPAGPTKSLWELLASRDPATFAANLRAAGFQVGMVRGAIYALLRDVQTPERTKAVDSITGSKYWKDDVTAEARAGYSKEISRLWLERDRTMRSIFPEEKEAFVLKMQSRFGPISEATMEKISRIEQDYSELQSQTRAQSGSGPRMPWAGEELALLDRERLKDIFALLSPTEQETYQMRGSPLGSALQRQLDGFEPTEQEYRDIYRQRAVVDELTRANAPYSFGSPEVRQAQEAMNAALKSTLGEARYAEYERGANRDYQSALTVTRELDLPASKAVEAYEIQRQARQRESSVRAAGSDPAQRQAQLAAIAAETKQKLAVVLGAAGAEQYTKGSQRGVIFLGN